MMNKTERQRRKALFFIFPKLYKKDRLSYLFGVQ